ncbi:DUF4902 domain-containing protein [Rhodoferax sp. GW822-FHT02A01]|uniref:DUF4902 domain-containing protein n=1 Tax=Rhodoferax sp. GW822-FHT02A01 TaxID=3141537 RepID=UPI00315C7BEF
MSIDELLSTPMRHLVSGLDMEHRIGKVDCGQETDISGYTEWISTTMPAISIGWDWRIQSLAGPLQWQRVGAPRSNVMLMFTTGDDAGWDKNLEILSTVVDALPWREEIPQAVAKRYA